MIKNLKIGLFCALLALTFIACTRPSRTLDQKRTEMVTNQLTNRGINDRHILDAFSSVPREEFVLPEYKFRAYEDMEMPFGRDQGQTLDRPYEDAVMLSVLEISPTDKVLEVGTGSGYLTSLFSKLAKDVYSIEIEPEVSKATQKVIEKLGYSNIHLRVGDGFLGWPEFAPFDVILLTCSPPKLPKPLEEQLTEGGRMLIPMGGAQRFQDLVLYKKVNGKLIEVRHVAPTLFSPMKGKILQE